LLVPMVGMKRVILFLSLLTLSLAGLTREWQSRSVYQVLTDRFAGPTKPCTNLDDYCGGTWKGIKSKLDYIAGMGFSAIWISPIQHNRDKGYHGYWQDDMTSLNPHFGTEQDLIDLVTECHRRDIWVMLDVVANHMVTPWDQFPQGLKPFNKLEHFHACSVCPSNCNVMDWHNQQQVEDCRLFDMPDLNQTHPFVHDQLLSILKGMITKYKFDGVRIDTSCEVSKAFMADYTKASGVYCIGEIANRDWGYVGAYQQPRGPLAGVLHFPAYYAVRAVFAQKESMMTLEKANSGFPNWFGDLKSLGNFIENHDEARFAYLNPDMWAFKSALTYSIMSIGIPMVYEGTEHHLNGGDTPWNREAIWTSANYATTGDLYQMIRLMNTLKRDKKLWDEPQIQRFSDSNFYAFTRGSALVATTNVGGSGSPVSRTISFHPYAVGDKLCNLFWATDCTVVTKKGVDVILNHGEPKVFVPSK